jgi:hypothetical protein
VLGFHVDDVDAVYSHYKELHEDLIHLYREYETSKILEVYAYYDDKPDPFIDNPPITARVERRPDTGTLLRFVETAEPCSTTCSCILPGLQEVPALFDNHSKPAYFDHWVRISRYESLW